MTQHEYNTRHNTRQYECNTSKTQQNLFWFIDIFAAYSESSILGSTICLHFKTWKLKIAFSSKNQNRTGKSQGNGLLQLCFCLFVYLNNCIYVVKESFWVNIAGIILGKLDIQLLHLHLGGKGVLNKMRTHANRGLEVWVMSMGTFRHNIFLI